MARQVRIQYEGALYHVMARGNRRERIFVSADGADEILFLETLRDCCLRTGFRVWAWVLMGNHYHLLVETPNANLVDGMAWLQNTYTRRFNVRHRQWGRLFGDRYKSVVIGSGDQGGDRYLQTLIDYIHLNPVRAGLVPSGAFGNLLDYPWSSLSRGYAVSPKSRDEWLAVGNGLALFNLRDRAADRRRFIERLEKRIESEEQEKCGITEIEGQTLRSTLQKGWYWGAESFKEALLDQLIAAKGEDLPVAKDFRSSSQAHDHEVRKAERIIADAVQCLNLEGGKPEDFSEVSRGDTRRVAVAWALAKRTSLKQSWIAERLSMRSAGNVSEQIRRFAVKDPDGLPQEVRRWRIDYT